MIIVLLLLFQSLCLYCQRLVLCIHDRCFPRNARLLQEVAETVGDRKALQHLELLEQEQHKRRQKRRTLEPILPLGVGASQEACRFCAHSPQGYCRHHFHLQVHTRQQNQGSAEQDYKQLRRIRRELKRSLEQQKTQTLTHPARCSYRSYQGYQEVPQSPSLCSLSSGYASLAPSQEEAEQVHQEEEAEEQLQWEQLQTEEQLQLEQLQEVEQLQGEQLQEQEDHTVPVQRQQLLFTSYL